ncbi:TPA: hypothetical protein ACMDRZ_003653 [Vibrio cholerae]|uniref:hypothetical protein n=1 Tax=Vibrio cholerae TaxID=666 RepID=UPI0015818394|nr:hypothetical protein [Vibrio cholerae]QKU64652.1 hypothetical protein HPY17_15095 [Vibrio cholerae]QKU68554.1 hypothetical protein HPY10_15240 [Vibrio cholerae]
MWVIDTLEYLKERYAEEQDRFKHFEEKCSKFLTFLTAVVSVLAAWGAFAKDSLFSPNTPWMWVQLALFCIASLCLVCSWGHAILAIKIGDCPVLPKQGNVAVYLRDSNTSERDAYIFDCYVDTLKQLTKVIDDKSINLEHSYDELIYSAWAIGFLGVITILTEVLK